MIVKLLKVEIVLGECRVGESGGGDWSGVSV